MNLFPPLTVADKLSLTLTGLMRAVAACSDRRRPGGAMAVWLIRLIWTRVSRAHQRIQVLLARFQAGKLRGMGAPRQREGVGRRGTGAAVKRERPEGTVPRRAAWLLPLVPCEAANYACQLRLWLAEPEMVALLMASAQARRVLAPLCRMLGIEAAVLMPQPGDAGADDLAAAKAAAAERDEVARAWNLGVVRQPVAGRGPPGDGGWRLAQGP